MSNLIVHTHRSVYIHTERLGRNQQNVLWKQTHILQWGSVTEIENWKIEIQEEINKIGKPQTRQTQGKYQN